MILGSNTSTNQQHESSWDQRYTFAKTNYVLPNENSTGGGGGEDGGSSPQIVSSPKHIKALKLNSKNIKFSLKPNNIARMSTLEGTNLTGFTGNTLNVSLDEIINDRESRQSSAKKVKKSIQV